MRAGWVALLVAGSLLAGCSAQGAGDGPSRQSGSPAPSASRSASGSASPSAGASPSSGSSAASSVFSPDASLVPRTSEDGRRLAESVVLVPDDWGRGYVA